MTLHGQEDILRRRIADQDTTIADLMQAKGEVARLGERAAADANEIAAGGPFSIVALGGSNAEAA